MAWRAAFTPRRCLLRSNSKKLRLAWEWRAQDLANLPLQAFSALAGFLETCERELAWPPQWLAIITSLLPKSEVDLRCCTDSGVELGGTRRMTGALAVESSGTLQCVVTVICERASSACS